MNLEFILLNCAKKTRKPEHKSLERMYIPSPHILLTGIVAQLSND